MTERKRDLLWLILWVALFVAAWPLDPVRFGVVLGAAVGLYLLPSDVFHRKGDGQS